MADEAMTSLGDLLRAAKHETGLGLAELTVLSAQNDPYRIDTPTFHEAGKWFAAQLDRLGLHGKHLRGIHYALLGSTAMPSGGPYHNTAEAWEWLQNVASKAGRWLGYRLSVSTLGSAHATAHRWRAGWQIGAGAARRQRDVENAVESTTKGRPFGPPGC